MPRPRVLVIEDDLATLDVFSVALRSAGFHVDGVRRVSDALDALSHRIYAVVVADHDLPEIPGLHLLAALHGAAPTAARIVCSGTVTEELLAEAREFGAFAVIPKPVSLERLARTVAAAVRRDAPPDV